MKGFFLNLDDLASEILALPKPVIIILKSHIGLMLIVIVLSSLIECLNDIVYCNVIFIYVKICL